MTPENISEKDKALVSIVIPNYKTLDKLAVCLQSIQATCSGIPYEVIVIENGSGDNSAEVIARDFPWVHLIVNQVNNYFSGANNQGFAQSRGEYIFILNSDTELIGPVLENMVTFLEQPENSGVGACNCNIYYPDGTRQNAEYRQLTLSIFLMRFLILNKNFIQRNLPRLFNFFASRVYYRHNDENPVTCEILAGMAILVRRKIIDEIKGFDERYRLFFTDDELCERIRKLGYSLVSLPVDRIIHHHAVSTQRLRRANTILDEDIRLYIREHMKFPENILCYLALQVDRIFQVLYGMLKDLFDAFTKKKTG